MWAHPRSLIPVAADQRRSPQDETAARSYFAAASSRTYRSSIQWLYTAFRCRTAALMYSRCSRSFANEG